MKTKQKKIEKVVLICYTYIFKRKGRKYIYRTQLSDSIELSDVINIVLEYLMDFD